MRCHCLSVIFLSALIVPATSFALTQPMQTDAYSYQNTGGISQNKERSNVIHDKNAITVATHFATPAQKFAAEGSDPLHSSVMAEKFAETKTELLGRKGKQIVAANEQNRMQLAQAAAEGRQALDDENTQAVRTRSMNLRQLGIDYELKLRGVSSSIGIPFGVRTNELVQSASLNLRYSYSPSLLPELSHLRVSVNGVTVSAIELNHDESGKFKTVSVPIDPRLIAAFNRINLELSAHYSRDCENPDHSSLWATIDAGSTLTLNTRPVALANELSLLPEPFFDPRDTRRLELPFYFSQKPDKDLLQSAGIVASYFGALAGYRGAVFPVYTSKPTASGDAVYVSTTTGLPSSIVEKYPEITRVDGPGVAVIPNPNDPYGKVLLVFGQDVAQVKIAASAVALHAPLSGSVSVVKDFNEGAPRQPYDAPKWVSSSRPVHFGDVVDQSGQSGKLSVTGYQPEVIRVGLQIPPDLFVWGHEGVPMTLKYRYTVPNEKTASTLNVNINEAFVTALPLDGHPYAEWPPIRWWNDLSSVRGKMPIIQNLIIPTRSLSPNSQLRFQFLFDRHDGKQCVGTFPDVSAAVDPDSTIDFSQFPHYMAMPNLAAFGNAGFPFTRMADLSDTAVVLPNGLTDADNSNLLTLLGRFSAFSGYPATHVSLINADEVAKYSDKNFLVIGSMDSQPLFETWKEKIPVGQNSVDHTNRFNLSDWLLKRLPTKQTTSPGWNGALSYQSDDSEGFLSHIYHRLIVRLARYVAQHDEARINAKVSMQTQPGDVLIMGFESPLKKGSSVVALHSEDPADMESLFDAWFDPDLISKIQGSVVLLRQGDVKSLANGHNYYVGQLPIMTWLRWYLPSHPVWLGVAVLAFCFVLAAIVRTLMQIQTSSRLRHGGS